MAIITVGILDLTHFLLHVLDLEHLCLYKSFSMPFRIMSALYVMKNMKLGAKAMKYLSALVKWAEKKIIYPINHPIIARS